MKDNKIKSSAEKITMPDELRTRIMDRCREVETTMNKTSMNKNTDNGEYTDHVFTVERVKSRNILRSVSAAAACAVLVGGIGATGFYMQRQNKLHQSAEITDGNADITETASEIAEPAETAETTEAVTENTEETIEATTEAVAEFDKAEILKYIVVPPEDVILSKVLSYTITDTDINGNEVSAEVLNDLPYYMIASFRKFMANYDFTEAERPTADISPEDVIDFRLVIPYNENTNAVFEFYKNNICHMQVYKFEGEDRTENGKKIIIEEQFFYINTDAARSSLQDEQYSDGADFDEHDLSNMPEGYVCMTPSFEYGDVADISVLDADEERIVEIRSLDADEFSKVFPYLFDGCDWSAHEISEDDSEMTLFEYRAPKLEYMVRVTADNGFYVCAMLIYSDGYVKWFTNENDVSMAHTYKFDNSEILDRFDKIFNDENVNDHYDYIKH